MLTLLALQGVGLGLAIRFVLGAVETVVSKLVGIRDDPRKSPPDPSTPAGSA